MYFILHYNALASLPLCQFWEGTRVSYSEMIVWIHFLMWNCSLCMGGCACTCCITVSVSRLVIHIRMRIVVVFSKYIVHCKTKCCFLMNKCPTVTWLAKIYKKKKENRETDQILLGGHTLSNLLTELLSLTCSHCEICPLAVLYIRKFEESVNVHIFLL